MSVLQVGASIYRCERSALEGRAMSSRMTVLTAVVAISAGLGCSTSDPNPPPADSGTPPPPADPGVLPPSPDAGFAADAEPQGPADTGTLLGPIEPTPQREGDPARGYHALVNEGYVGCGL